MKDRDVQITYTYKGLEVALDASSREDVNAIASDLEKIARALIEVVDRLEKENTRGSE